MYIWFQDIFQSSSDKARLITVIIASIIAISVVLINQFFNTQRIRKETQIEKLELVYEEILKAEKYISDILEKIIKEAANKEIIKMFSNNIDEDYKKIIASVQKITMLASLYFPGQIQGQDEISDLYTDLFIAPMKSVKGMKGMKGMKAENIIALALTTRDKSGPLIKKTKYQVETIMKNTMH